MISVKTILKYLSSSSSKKEPTTLPVIESGKLTLIHQNITIGYLSCEKGKWHFKYSEEFKNQNEYHSLIGFPDLNKEYVSEYFWPFFRIRIPGLKQPAIKEIVEKEKLDIENEFQLLKRFGHKTISNPFELV